MYKNLKIQERLKKCFTVVIHCLHPLQVLLEQL